MARPRLAGVVSLALMTIGGLGAHAIAYRLVDAAGGGHAPEHEAAHAAAHGYLAYWPLCVAMCGAVVLGALVLGVARTRASSRFAPPLWLFGILPPFGFAVQEHLERLAATGTFPYAAAFEATFVLGLLLQLPFALAAYVAARALIALAVAVATRYRRRLRGRRSVPPRFLCPSSIALRPAPALALGYGERGPPAPPL